jgi:DNA-binding phage protein
MTPMNTNPFDPAEYLDNTKAISAYMAEALETADPAFIADAHAVIARASRNVLRPKPCQAP